MTCPYCLSDIPDTDLPAHLAAHQAGASVDGVTVAVEALVAYQEMVTRLLRELRQERERRQAVERELAAWVIQADLA